MMDQIDFLMKHKRIREASETVLLMESPRRWGKSWLGMEIAKQRPVGKVGNYTFTTEAGFFIKYWPITKKMKSKSKQSRYVRVVMKGEWK